MSNSAWSQYQQNNLLGKQEQLIYGLSQLYKHFMHLLLHLLTIFYSLVHNKLMMTQTIIYDVCKLQNITFSFLTYDWIIGQ